MQAVWLAPFNRELGTGVRARLGLGPGGIAHSLTGDMVGHTDISALQGPGTQPVPGGVGLPSFLSLPPLFVGQKCRSVGGEPGAQTGARYHPTPL